MSLICGFACSAESLLPLCSDCFFEDAAAESPCALAASCTHGDREKTAERDDCDRTQENSVIVSHVPYILSGDALTSDSKQIVSGPTIFSSCPL